MLLDDGDAPTFLQLVNPLTDAVHGSTGNTGNRGREFN